MSLAAACLSWTGVIWLWEPCIFALTVDDTYYYLKTAVHISAGHGPTFDRLNPTNGFHPLWMLILAALATPFGSNIDVFVRLVLGLQTGLVAMGAILVAGTISSAGRWFVQLLAFALLNFYVAKVLLNGQESALQWLLLAACGFLVGAPSMGRLERRRPRLHAALRGACAGLLILARLNAVFFAIPLLVQPLLVSRNAQEALGVRLRVLLSAAVLLTVVAPYFAWNVVTTGHLLPVSGAIKETFVPSLPLSVRLAGAAVALAGVGAFGARLWRREGSGFTRLVFPLGVYTGLQFAYDFGVRGKLVPEIWYLVPQVMLLLVAGAWLVRRFAAGSRLSRSALFAALAVHCAVASGLWRFRTVPESFSRYAVARDVALWLQARTPADAVLAGWDSGIVGAFTEQRLINLDGLMNSYTFKQEYLDRGRVDEFISEVHRVEYLAQYVPRDQFLRSTVYRGVELAEWHVAHQVCFSFRSIARPWRQRELAYLVLSRAPLGPSVRNLHVRRQSLCA